jgi:predicted SnoaL-like aldol condensation-catalyzing enzyme
MALSRKTQIATQALKTVFDGGDTTVIDRFVRPDYIQHNPLAPDGPAAMKAFGAATRQQFPDATLDVRRAISDGDLVLLHSSGVLVPGTPGLAVFDIFRFQDGKIAEHWDAVQDVPETSANDNTMF